MSCEEEVMINECEGFMNQKREESSHQTPEAISQASHAAMLDLLGRQ